MAPLGVRWQNFRAFVDTGEVELAPVTLVIGSNSSGKTSLHLPLLLLKQTLEARDESIGLVTRGDLANVGTYRDLIHLHDTSNDLSFDVRFAEHQKPKNETDENPQPGEASMAFDLDETASEVRLREYEVHDVYGGMLFRRVRNKDGSFSLTGMGLGRSRAATAARNEMPQRFLFDGYSVLTNVIREARGGNVEIPGPVSSYMARAGFTAGGLTSLLAGISYIGPLRERPRRRYELSAEMPENVGTRGQSAPEILFRNQGNPVLDEVESWLRDFGAGAAFGFSESAGTFSVELKARRGEPRVNLADTGFGVSQVLPLIVQGLTAEPGSLVIAEQPEIHLNPRYQALLGNLFAAVAKRGVTVLVETHSEHLLLRLRRQIADGDLEADRMALYFVEKEHATSSVKPVPIGENGHISPEEWPTGFFSEALDDALALATSQRKRGVGGNAR